MKARFPGRLDILQLLQGVDPTMTNQPFPEIFTEIARACGNNYMDAQEIFNTVIGAVVDHIGEVSTHPVHDIVFTIPGWIGTIVDQSVVKEECYSLFNAWLEDPDKYDRPKYDRRR